MPGSRVASVQAVLAQRFPDAVSGRGWTRGIVPSGVAEVSRLQAKEGFVYLRP